MGLGRRVRRTTSFAIYVGSHQPLYVSGSGSIDRLVCNVNQNGMNQTIPERKIDACMTAIEGERTASVSRDLSEGNGGDQMSRKISISGINGRGEIRRHSSSIADS